MTCECVREMLELFSDGEVNAAQSEEIKRHVEACSGCRERLAEIEKLNALVVSSSLDNAPDVEENLKRIRRKLRASSARRMALPLAAGALLALGLIFAVQRPPSATPVDPQVRVRELLQDYLREAGSIRERVADEITAYGADGARVVVEALQRGDARTQVELSKLLGRYRDERVRSIILEYVGRQEPLDRDDDILSTLGSENGDAELIPSLFSMLGEKKRDTSFVKKVLRDLDRGGLNRAADERIKKSVLMWMRSSNSELVRKALEIADAVNLKFDVPQIIELLDASDTTVRNNAHEFLVKKSGQDFGLDKAKWTTWAGTFDNSR